MPLRASNSVHKQFVAALVLTILLFSCSSEDGPVVTAAEELFINEVYTAGEDWIELYSNAAESKNLSGYRIFDDGISKYQLPANTSIPANGFLIIVCNDVGNGLEANFKLSSAGETVYLENPAGELVDFVEVPKLDNGQSYGRFPDGSATFSISGNTSRAASNTDANTPAITRVTRAPLVPTLNQAVVVQAELVNAADLSTIKLYYKFSGSSYSSVNMAAEGAFYNATIPSQSITGKMDYYVEVTSKNGVASYKPYDAPVDSYSYLLNTDALPNLVINEFMAANTSCCADTDGSINEFDDWIEIYNSGQSAVNVGGMYLSDDVNDPFKAKIPTNNSSATTIPPGGFLLFWADEQQGQGTQHVNFKLAATGEAVGLFYIDGRTIDAKTFGVQSPDKSLGRSPNGSSTWSQFSSPTPGNSNN